MYFWAMGVCELRSLYYSSLFYFPHRVYAYAIWNLFSLRVFELLGPRVHMFCTGLV